LRLLADDNAVSESLGFVLLAFIIMMAMTLVVMMGYPMYQNAINEGHLTNMEEGFYLLSANANKVVTYESPIQSSELKLYGGTLWLRDDGYFNIEYTHDSVNDVYTHELPVMEYVINDKKIAYVLGGVCKRDGIDSSIMLRDPLSYGFTANGKDTLVLPLVDYTNVNGALAGEGLTRVTISSPYYAKMIGTLNYPNAIRVEKVSYIKINMSSEYTDSFSRYFQGLGFIEDSNTNNHLIMHRTCNPEITMYIVPSRIQINVD
jgi:hypothetical protein